MLWENNSYWSQFKGTQGWVTKPRYMISSAKYSELLDIFNKELLDICKENNVEVIDIANMVPNESKYYYDNVHNTEAGTELIANILSEYLNNTVLKN